MNKPFLAIILAIVSLFAVCLGYGQGIMPVSPEAATLTKMVNYPVSYYTGIPDIRIPLYEIEVGELKLPITLQYHAGGFKINEKSTRVGLGWSLSCDLQITREINGLDDFAYNGYKNNTKMTSAPYPFYDYQNVPFPNFNKYEIANGQIDGQPDKFYYKLLDKSGSFFIAKNATGTGCSFIPIPHDNVRIEFQEPNFIITDSDGTKYYFGSNNSAERSRETTTVTGSLGSITTWKCIRIVNSLGRVEFSFKYDEREEKNKTKRDFIEYYSAYWYNQSQFGTYYRIDQSPLLGQTSFNGFSYPLFRVSNPKYIECISNNNWPVLHIPSYNDTTESFVDNELYYTAYGYPTTTPITTVSGLVLKEITFRGGKVIFYGTDALTSIVIKSHDGQIAKAFTFYQTYKAPNNLSEAKKYNGDSFKGTLYLDSLTMESSSQAYETYRFMYHDKFCYGNHLTGHDAWRYPNSDTREIYNMNVSPILPSVSWPETYYFSVCNYNDKVDSVFLTTPGSPWTLFSDEDAMRKGVLKRIIYPTGGFVDFDFEANRYPIEMLVQDHSPYMDAYPSVFPQLCGGLRIRSINFYEPGATKPTTQKYYKYGKNENGMGELIYAPRINTDGDSYNLSPVITSQFIAHAEWPCDGYIIQQCSTRNMLTLLSLEKKKMIYPASALDYSYGNGVFTYYTEVTEYDVDLGVSSGKTVYSYFSPKDFFTNYWEYRSHITGTITPYIKTGIYNDVKKSITTYRFTPEGKFQLSNKTSFEYEKREKPQKIQVAFADFNIIYQVHAGVGNDTHMELYNNNYSSPTIGVIDVYENGDDFFTESYAIPFTKLLMKHKFEQYYDESGNEINTVTTYDYDDAYWQVSSEQFTSSEGKQITRRFKYSYDFGGVYTDMKNKNLTRQVIEEQVLVNGKKEKTIKNNYKKISAISPDFIVPSSVVISYANNPSKVEISFDEYDQHGNVSQLTGKDQVPVSYLWGYCGLYPVAELKGVTYATIPGNFKSSSNLFYPQNDAVLQGFLSELKNSITGNALITGFTYKWLTGVSSRIDANGLISRYEYDPYGRLTAVKDNKGQTIQTYAYNMANPTPWPFAWCTNTPQLLSVTKECPSGLKQSYSVILPGAGNYTALSTEGANRFAREAFYADSIGISFPPDCNDQRVRVVVGGLYSTWENPFFTNSCTVDFIQDSTIVYSVEMPMSDFDDFNTPYQTIDLYVQPGTYVVSMRPYPGTRYSNGNIPTYGCQNITTYNDHVSFDSTSGTVTFNLGTVYEIYMHPAYAKKVTPVEFFP